MESTDIAASIDGLGRAFEAFKSANDERLAQIEKNGAPDSLTVAAVDQLTDRMDGIEVALKRTPLVGTARDPDEQKAAADFFSVLENRPLTPDDARVDVGTYRAYDAALRRYIRTGKPSYDEQKALSVGIEADGGYWVIPEISDMVKTRLFETSPMRSIASVMTIGTDALEFPVDTNDATSGGWVGETDARSETATPQIGEGRIPVHEQYANPRATQKLLDDASFPVETWLANKIGDKLRRNENVSFCSGNGEAKPRGFLDYGSDANTDDDAARSWGTLQYVPSGNASGFDTTDPGDALIDLVTKLNPAYLANARWVMKRATIGEVRKFKDGQGNYLWQMGNIQGGQPATLLGFPVVAFEDMPAVAANNFHIAFGDFSEGYMIVERQGIRILRDPFSAKPYVQFYTTKRVGGDVVNFDAIKLLKIATS
jgi:HK97 family phage major capsid protein